MDEESRSPKIKNDKRRNTTGGNGTDHYKSLGRNHQRSRKIDRFSSDSDDSNVEHPSKHQPLKNKVGFYKIAYNNQKNVENN